jgi:signal transduction histidine kinase
MPAPAGDPVNDLRTPLHAIRGNVELLIRTESNAMSIEGRRSLAEIAQAVSALEAALGWHLKEGSAVAALGRHVGR